MQSRCSAYAAALLAALLPLSSVAAAGDAYSVELVPLKPDVYLVRRPEPLREPVEPNALFIVNPEDVVVFEGGGAPLVAERTIALIRSVTDNPVSHVVNSHWHGDHNLGNQVYRAEFPGVKFVAHPETRAAMTGPPMAYVERYGPMLTDLIDDWRDQQSRGELTPARTRLLPDLVLMRDQIEQVTVVPPEIMVADRLVLERGGREIHVVHLGRGNTPGDLVLWLPRERVLATGDLVVHPIPYGFGSFPAEWIATLDRLADFDFELLVPGHGELQRDARYIRRLQAMLAEVRRQAGEAVAAGLDLETAQEQLELSAFEAEFAGDDEDRKRKFEAWWRRPITRSAWLEARGEEIKQGASDETG
jgi:cyclase